MSEPPTLYKWLFISFQWGASVLKEDSMPSFPDTKDPEYYKQIHTLTYFAGLRSAQLHTRRLSVGGNVA